MLASANDPRVLREIQIAYARSPRYPEVPREFLAAWRREQNPALHVYFLIRAFSEALHRASAEELGMAFNAKRANQDAKSNVPWFARASIVIAEEGVPSALWLRAQVHEQGMKPYAQSLSGPKARSRYRSFIDRVALRAPHVHAAVEALQAMASFRCESPATLVAEWSAGEQAMRAFRRVTGASRDVTVWLEVANLPGAWLITNPCARSLYREEALPLPVMERMDRAAAIVSTLPGGATAFNSAVSAALRELGPDA